MDRIHQRLGQTKIPTNISAEQTQRNARKEPVEATKDSEAHNETYAKKVQSEKANINDKKKQSITNNLDKGICERSVEQNIDVYTAYTVDADIDAKYREKNFMRIVPEKLQKKKYDTLVLQGGSIEVTNLNTREELKDKNFPAWRKKIEESSIKMFELAEKSILENPGL